MDNCSIPNCKQKSSEKFRLLKYKADVNLWKKILKISSKNLSICDSHLSIICQSCTRSLDTSKPEDSFVITEDFQQNFEDTIGYEIPPGVVCPRCHNRISDFAKFREYVRKQQEIRINISKNETELDKNEEQDEIESDQNQDTEYDQAPQFEVVEFQDEEYIVEVKEPNEHDEINNAEEQVKQENVEYEHLEEISTIKSEPMDYTEYSATDETNGTSFQYQDNNQEESPETIIKVEPTEFEYSEQEYQVPTDDLLNEIESKTSYFPKISNPRTIPNHHAPQSLKRKVLHPEISKVAPTSPNILQASLRSVLESTKIQPPKRMKFPQRSLKCQYCTERFDNCDLILEHIEEKHKFQCPTCLEAFPFKINLIQHQFLHHKEDKMDKKNSSTIIYRHPCMKCSMKFSSSENLEIHMRKNHNCDLKGLRVCVEEEEAPPSLSSRILNSFKKGKPGSSGITKIKKES